MAILEIKYDKLKTFTKKFDDHQMSQGFKLCFSELMQEAKYGKFVMPQRDLKSFKNIDFGMGVSTSKVSHCKSQLWNNWANATFTYLEINVAQHWDILAKDLQFDKIDQLDFKLFNGALNHYYRNVHLKMVARNKLRLFLIKGMWKIMPMNFKICAPA